jgi:RNA polymerase sigma factor (TIGR02999 family)
MSGTTDLSTRTDTLPPIPAPEGAAADRPVDAWFAHAYRELRLLARARLRAGGRDAVLDTTALVHETFLKLSANAQLAFPDRPRFLVYAGQVMRSVIVDLARQRLSERRGGGAPHVTFTVELAGSSADADEIVRVHDALEALARLDPRMARVVELRYFGGLTETEIGEALGVTDRTVRRDWEQARLFLADALTR